MIHSGHYNAIRQAKALCDVLVVGVNSDEEIMRAKGPAILTTAERAEIIRSCRWVDEVAEGTEYTVNVGVLDRYNCDFYAHGDDVAIDADGNDICAILAAQGRFRMFKRTTGVSTTDIIGKLLSLTKQNRKASHQRQRSGSVGKPLRAKDYIDEVRKTEEEHFNVGKGPDSVGGNQEDNSEAIVEGLQARDPLHPQQAHSQALGLPRSNFLATTRRIMHFSARKEPGPGDKVVYLAGSFDCLHNGHIELIKKAKAEGDFLYVGVWEDDLVQKFKGSNYPILSLHERVLMVMANKYVDDVVIGAPFQMNQDLITTLNIQVVVDGKLRLDEVMDEFEGIDPFEVPK